MGADVRLDPAGFDIGIRQSWQDALAEVEVSTMPWMENAEPRGLAPWSV